MQSQSEFNNNTRWQAPNKLRYEYPQTNEMVKDKHLAYLQPKTQGPFSYGAGQTSQIMLNIDAKDLADTQTEYFRVYHTIAFTDASGVDITKRTDIINDTAAGHLIALGSLNGASADDTATALASVNYPLCYPGTNVYLPWHAQPIVAWSAAAAVTANTVITFNSAAINWLPTIIFMTQCSLSKAGIGALFNSYQVSNLKNQKIEELANQNILTAIYNKLIPSDYRTILIDTERSDPLATLPQWSGAAGGPYTFNTYNGSPLYTYYYNPQNLPTPIPNPVVNPANGRLVPCYLGYENGTNNATPAMPNGNMYLQGPVYGAPVTYTIGMTPYTTNTCTAVGSTYETQNGYSNIVGVWNPPIGIMNTQIATDLGAMSGLSFTFNLENPNRALIYNNSGTQVTLGTADTYTPANILASTAATCTYSISRFEMILDRMTPEQNYKDGRNAVIAAKNSIKIPFYRVFGNSGQINNGATGQIIIPLNQPLRSAKTLYFVMIDQTLNFEPKADSLSTFINPGMVSYQINFGGTVYPSFPITTLGAEKHMAYMELIKSRGLYKAYTAGTLIDYNKYDHHIYCINLETVTDQISGISMVGEDVNLTINMQNPYPNMVTCYGFYVADSIIDLMANDQIMVTV